MRITYDPEADALYIALRDGRPNDSRDLEEGVTVDVDSEGHIIGLEVLDALERLGPGALSTIALERFPLDDAPPA